MKVATKIFIFYFSFGTITAFASNEELSKIIYGDLMLLNKISNFQIVDTSVVYSESNDQEGKRLDKIYSWSEMEKKFDCVVVNSIDSAGSFFSVDVSFKFLVFKCREISLANSFKYLLFKNQSCAVKKIDGFIYSEILDVINYLSSLRNLTEYKEIFKKYLKYKNEPVKLQKFLKVSILEEIALINKTNVAFRPVVVSPYEFSCN